MLSPVYLSSCTDDILKLYEELNDAVVRDVVRRLVNLDFDVSQSAVWQMERIQEIGFRTYEDTISEIARITGKSEKELKKLFEDAGTETMRYDNSVYKKAGLSPLSLAQSPAMLQILTAGYRKCKGELKNLTLTTANMSQSLFINACNKAYMKVSSGAFSYTAALQQAIEEIGDSGAWVLYPSGRRDRVDVAVRRAVLTGVSQTCGELQLRQLDDMMWDVVDTTAHMGARASHAVWQGGRFSYKGRNKNYPDFEEATGYGTAGGLMGVNCRHNFYPAVDGSPRMYSQAQLDEWKNHKVTYNGTEYSDREALDMQRAYERGIRATKRKLSGLDEGIKAAKDEGVKKELSDAFAKAGLQLKNQEAALSDFLNQTGFKREHDRTQVLGFDRSLSGKAKAAAKKESMSTYMGSSAKMVDNGGKSGIIKPVKINSEVQDVHYIGKIDRNILEKEFGTLKTSDVVLTEERKLHIKERHPDDFNIFEQNCNDIITHPQIILKDEKNKDTIFMIKHIDDTNLNIIVKLAVIGDKKHPKNSIMSSYRIRDKNVKKLEKRNKVLYKLE